MFRKKHFVIFIGKHFIEPGVVTLGSTPSFEGYEPLAYTIETLPEDLRRVGGLTEGRNVRVVLSEELVYVTELSFLSGIRITRESVRQKAEESIPEDLRATEWDFQTLHYAEKREQKAETSVQVAVMERSFVEAFRKALESAPLPLESIVPESYVLASLTADQEGVSVIVEADRESTVLVATERGSVIATYVKGAVTPDDVAAFLVFVKEKNKAVKRIIFSHFSEEETGPFRAIMEEGHEILMENLNPLVGATSQEVSGKDEMVLNIDMFRSDLTRPWWRFWKNAKI